MSKAPHAAAQLSQAHTPGVVYFSSLASAAVLFLALLGNSSAAYAQTAPPAQNGGTQASAPVGETIDDDDVLRVDSNLVSIPAIVTETTGRPVTNLRLEDFELRVDGQLKPVGELHRADAPVVLAVLFDNSSSLSRAREFEKQAAVRFFQRIVRPIDHAAIYSVSTVPVLARPLTNNVGMLVRTVEQFAEPEGATALFDTISEASSYLRSYSARKVIVIVSDGNDTISESTFDQALQRALKSDCQIYVVGTGDIEHPNQTDSIAKRRLQVLAAQTGGALYVPRSVEELDLVFEQISNDISQQYVLSYFPTDDPADGRLRTIDLRIRTRPTLRVRAREGYYATAGGPSAKPSAQMAALQPMVSQARVRPRRARSASDAGANGVGKGSAQDLKERVASLDPLYSATPEASNPLRASADVSSEITFRTKAATRPVTQTGPQEQIESFEPSRNLPVAEASEPPPARVADPVSSPPPQTVPVPTVLASSTRPAVASTNHAEPAKPQPAPVEKEGSRKVISGGVLNGKALSLPMPSYPVTARNAGAKGAVRVQVEINEDGKVVKADAISGHVLLQNAAVNAARQARFSPTLLSGQPIKITGVIVYNFL